MQLRLQKQATFAVAGPKAWNHLPADIREIDTVRVPLKLY